jgi:DNA-binding PadR family transcriptional regulator
MMNSDEQFEVFQFSTHTFTPARLLGQIPGFYEKLDQFLSKFETQQLRQAESSKPSKRLSKNERAFLDHLSLKEYEPVNIIFSLIGNISSGAQQQIIKKLKKLEYIKTIRERTEKIYIVFASLTDAGRKHINKPLEKNQIRGDTTHRNTTLLKRDLDLKQGAENCVLEFQYPNSSGFSDLGSKFNGKWHCTEVVVDCKANINDHVKSCFLEAAGQVETLTIVTLLKSEHKNILEKIMSDPELVFFVNRIKFMTLEQIIKELY